MRSERTRDADANVASSRPEAGFATWGWAGWLWGILCWLGFVYFTYPTAAGVYRGEFGPMSPMQWFAQSFYYILVFVPAFAFTLYAGWVFFVVLCVRRGKITVGRWFGTRRVTYATGDVVAWRLVGYRSQEVSDATWASRLRIDFADGSWVRISRYAWNFRKLEQWLRQASGASPSAHRFVVHDVWAKLLALTGWVMCWFFVGRSLTHFLSPASHRPWTLGDAAIYTILLILDLGLIVGCAFASHELLKKVRVNGPHIRVDRWFGLNQRTYHENDIKSWRATLDRHPPWWRQARMAILVVRLTDGSSLVVAGSAANFHALHDYLRVRVPSREEVRRASRVASATEASTLAP